MNKTLIIFKREYWTRVSKKSFLILTIVTPLLFGLLMFLPMLLALHEDEQENKVAVMDHSSLFLGHFSDSKATKFEYISEDQYLSVKDNLSEKGFYALLDIPADILNTNRAIVYSKKQINIDVKSQICSQLDRIIEAKKRSELINRIGIPDLNEQLQNTQTSINVETIKMNEDGSSNKGSTEVAMIAGYIIGFIIYMFVLLYGNMVMRGVLEEKQNRIVEVIISSVKPVQLMMGKILGIAAVGLTQVLIWVVLMIGIFIGIKALSIDEDTATQIVQSNTESIMAVPGSNANEAIAAVAEPSVMEEVFEQIEGINFPLIIATFIIYFILGYLLYSSMMAAVASAVDSDEDLQQFTLPITIPLIAALVILVNVIKNPDGALALWTSYIPFTSPIIMMVRIPFGVAWWEILTSLTILALSTYACIWAAAKIYRTGILMYGKKVTWKELGKWLTFKN